MRTEPPRPPVRRVVPCSCPACSKPAGVQTDTILSIETRHGHRAVLSLHDLAAAAGYRLVPVERPPSGSVWRSDWMRDQLTPGDVYLQIGPLVLHLQISQEDDVFVQIDDPRLPGTPSLPTRILTAAEWREIRNALYVTHPQAPS